jgi:hypothetical protein
MYHDKLEDSKIRVDTLSQHIKLSDLRHYYITLRPPLFHLEGWKCEWEGRPNGQRKRTCIYIGPYRVRGSRYTSYSAHLLVHGNSKVLWVDRDCVLRK